MRFLEMSHNGHDVIEYDNSEAEVAQAMERFRMLVEEHKNIAAVKVSGGDAKLVRSFGDLKPDDEVLFHRQLVGG